MDDADPQTAAEAGRLAALRALDVLDTPPEPVFDAIAAAAARACGVPIALVSLVDRDRQWFKANVGLPGVGQTPREVAFCHHAIRGDAPMEVDDALADARFAANPLVTGDPKIRFYAGAPIVLPGGDRVGTVCVIDRAPRHLDDAQVALLADLGRIASNALVDRQRQTATMRELAASEARYRAIVEDQSELVSLARSDGTLTFVNAAYARHYGLAPDRMVGRNLLDFVADADRDAVAGHLHAVAEAPSSVRSGINRSCAADGSARWVEWTNRSIAGDDGAPATIHSVGRDITEQRRADERLREALRDKEVLLKEVYHRVKNNLQVVQSLLSLQQRTTGDAAAQAVLVDSARRVRAMALVHEKLYQASTLSAVSLRGYLRDLLDQIAEATRQTGRRVEIVLQVDVDREVSLDSAIPFGLLVNELVFNALEHAFGDRPQGRIRVALTGSGTAARLEVADDGQGLPAGFDLDASPSMGLQLAASLASQLGGSLAARSDGGAVFATAVPRL